MIYSEVFVEIINSLSVSSSIDFEFRLMEGYLWSVQ